MKSFIVLAYLLFELVGGGGGGGRVKNIIVL